MPPKEAKKAVKAVKTKPKKAKPYKRPMPFIKKVRGKQSPGWNDYNSFKQIVPSLFQVQASGKHTGTGGTTVPQQPNAPRASFSQKEIGDLYTRFGGEYSSIVNKAKEYWKTQGGVDKYMTSRESYLQNLKEYIANNPDDFTTMGGDMSKYYETTMASLREGRDETAAQQGIFADATLGQRHDPVLDRMTGKPTTEARAGTAVPGTRYSGLGTMNARGELARGITSNLGGGTVDTQVESTSKGDVVTIGSQSVNTAQKTLRGSFVVVGGEHVKPDEATNLQSDVLFEAFSWVPDGYGLGPNNNLHLQNKQNDHIRFGMNPLSVPRRLEDTNGVKPPPDKWQEALDDGDVLKELVDLYGMDELANHGVAMHQSNPIKVLDHDYNNYPSYKQLPRQVTGPSPFAPTIDNINAYLPATDPPGQVMDHLEFQDTLTGTFGSRRLNTFASL